MKQEKAYKIKLIKILEILRQDSDEDHYIESTEILSKLAAMGIECDRRTLYGDIDVLNDFGYEVLCEKNPGKPNKYCVVDRSFDVPELRILMDAVQASSFITPSKTKVLLDKITCNKATADDIEKIYQLCKKMIDDYENIDSIDYDRVLKWVHKKIEKSIDEYTVIYVDDRKAGYYHFYKNEDGENELDDLYIFSEYQDQGVGSEIIKKCCALDDKVVTLYVFIKNQRAVSLYQRLGFEIVRTVNNSRYIMKKENRKYYEAYEERYKTAHAHGVSWSSDVSTPIVIEMLDKYNITQEHKLLEIGCGEGRDSKSVLERGFQLMATDISKEAIAYCKKLMPQFENHFSVLDCLSDKLDVKFDFIFGIAVIHMLVLDDDRNGFYQFIHNHLTKGGVALICTMGDGEFEKQSDISTAFTLQERNHELGKMMVAETSCRMVSFNTFEKELARNGLTIIEKGITSSLPNFNSLMYAVVKK